VIVCLGDEVDFHGVSRWPKDPDGFSAGHELDHAIRHLTPWFSTFPEVYVCTSNHTARPFKSAYNIGLPAQLIKSYQEFLGSPPLWRWSDRWQIDGVCYEHGEGKSGKNAAINIAIDNRMSTVIGHQHSNGGIQYAAGRDNIIFGVNSGCLIDVTKYAFAYAKAMRNKPTLGATVVIDGVPFFFPMILNKAGRWVKEIPIL
jgi:hypothetical protein